METEADGRGGGQASGELLIDVFMGQQEEVITMPTNGSRVNKGTARACLELLSATSLPLMVERLMGRLQAFPLHLTLLYISSS